LKYNIHAQFWEVGKALRFYMSALENVAVAGETFGEFLVAVNEPTCTGRKNLFEHSPNNH
jgi:hypothetical protein